VDMTFSETDIIFVAHILVGIDLREGLATKTSLKKGGHSLSQPLEYLGVPFWCIMCQMFDHIDMD